MYDSWLTRYKVKQEIKKNGPIYFSMTVYEDFTNYKSGIYHHVEGKSLGGHAIKVVGWGVERGDKYWIAANSWSEDWGEGGFFRIGMKEKNFGYAAGACEPDL